MDPEKNHRFLHKIKKVLDWFYHPSNLRRAGLLAAALISGLFAVGYATIFKIIELKATSIYHEHPLIFLISCPSCFLLGWWLVYEFAPKSAGSGIPQVMASIELEEGKDSPVVDEFLSLKIIVVKTVSSLLCVFGGGAIGREGPTLQISASIFYVLGKKFRGYIQQLSLDIWILAGAAAGLAAAFNTPLGGIVYAIEELGREHFNRVRTIVLWSVVISGLVSQWLVGSYLYLGNPTTGPIAFGEIPAAIVIGIVGGLMGSSFGEFIFVFQVKFRSGKSFRYLAGVTFICAVILILLRYVDERAVGPGNHFMSEILAGHTVANVTLVITRFLSASVSYLSGCAGGIFAPSLAMGSALGSWFTTFWPGLNPVLFALLGMAAVLTGVTRAPFTSFVLILEMTDRHNAVFLLIITSMISLVVAQVFGHESFYEKTKKIMISQYKPGTTNGM